MSHAIHVCFVAPRALIEGAVEAMGLYAESRDERVLAGPLGEAWSRRQERRQVQLIDLDATERRRIGRSLGDDPGLVHALGAVPFQVRKAALADVHRQSSLLQRLRQMAAPQVVQDRARRSLAAGIASLDPAAPMPAQEPPGLCHVDDDDGREIVNLHDWLEQLLRAARGARGSSIALARRPAAEPGAASPGKRATPPLGGRCWPGIELTTYGTEPGHPMWTHPRLLLPRPLEAGGTVVVGVTGGPATFAVPGDAPGSSLDEALAREIRALSPDDAVVSFVALDGEIAEPWGGD